MKYFTGAGGSRSNSPFETDEAAEARSPTAKNGPLRPIQCYDPHIADALIHADGTLAGLRLVRDCRKRASQTRQ